MHIKNGFSRDDSVILFIFTLFYFFKGYNNGQITQIIMKKVNRKTIYILVTVAIALTALLCWVLTIVQMVILVQSNDRVALSEFLAAQKGFTGYFALYLISILQVVSIILPGMVFQVAGAWIFGWWRSFLICWAGFVTGNAIVFFLARFFGRSLIEAMGIEQRSSWLLDKMNSADPRIVTMLACLVPGVPNGIIPYVASMCDMRLYSFVIAIAVSSWVPILLNCLAGHFLFNGQYRLMIMCFALQIVSLVVFALCKDKVFAAINKKPEEENKDTDEETENGQIG